MLPAALDHESHELHEWGFGLGGFGVTGFLVFVRFWGMGDDVDFLSGVFNYCDRWCERCLFIERCRVGVAEIAFRKEFPRVSEGEDEAVMRCVTKSFEEAFRMIAEEAERLGISLDDLESEGEEAMKGKVTFEDMDEHPLVVMATEYLKEAMEKLQRVFSEERLAGKIGEWERDFSLGLKDEDAVRRESDLLRDAREVARWYLMQIGVKLRRCLVAVETVRNGDEMEADLAVDDRDVSGRLALKGLERSMGAWKVIGDLLLDSDGVEDFVILLGRIRQGLIREVPSVVEYRLPYFEP